MTAPARILLTNDDGLSSPGLMTLARELLKAGFDLRVAAPEREQSGVGHCVTLYTPLLAEAVTLPDDLAGVPAFKVAGTPADCVKLAITNLFPGFTPDLALSGINRGPNIGINVFYSGTVGGALEACINGIPAMALSLDIPPDGLWHFTQAAESSLPVIRMAIERRLPPWSILNVNAPNRPAAEVKGYRLTHHGRSGFKEFYTEHEPVDGRRQFILDGTMIYRDTDPCSDSVALRDGWVSVTPLGLGLEDTTCREHISSWPFLSTKAG
jgi:5'-nucleotidase